MDKNPLGVDPAQVALFIPPGLKAFKLNLFERIGSKIGQVVRHKFEDLLELPNDLLPVVGCTPELRPIIFKWQSEGRQWCYWDRGYVRRVFATDLPRGDNGGFYRWHLNHFQMQSIQDVPGDRWKAAETELVPWNKNGNHIVVASPSPTYERFHGITGWTEKTVAELTELTDRPIVVRDKEMQRRASDKMSGGRRLWDDIKEAHCLVTHGSNAAVEAVVMGCPVFVDKCSAAALVGLTDLSRIEEPIYPDRTAWVHSLCYHQFDEQELVDGTLWRLIT